MPTMPHEAPLMLLRERPALVPMLLRDALGLVLPQYSDVRIEEADFTQLVPTEYRADLVLTLAGRAPVMGIVVELQRATDADKRFTWPLYVAALHAKLRCPTCLVVVTVDAAVATWAATPITSLQPGSPFVPLVIGPDRIPWVTSPTVAATAPELAALSALAHGNEPDGLAVVLAALAAVDHLDDARRPLYADLILAALSSATRKALETTMDLGTYEFKSWIAQEASARGRAAGLTEGEAHGKAAAILAVLAARKVTVSDVTRQHILATTDVELLDRWIMRVATATTADEVVAD